ncbi:hypothetical protein [Streptomyces sp. KLOTTS4A1]|uniref:hypothetical protein n=1 Tax=Streptomyces sp. KLOTTS4A1 TaxID=3390996 RepID=UPI0039F57807
MSRFDELLGTDFAGEPASDLEDVIYEGLDDPRHRDRVPGLVELMNSGTAPEHERFLACVALTTWAEPAGLEAVLAAAAHPAQAPWYDCLIDRRFSVDNTFAQLSLAVSDSDALAGEKGTLGLRTEAFRALVRIAYREYFDEKLADLMDPATVNAVASDIETTVTRGLAAIESSPFDLATQLVDLAAALTVVDGARAVRLAMDVLAVSSGPRTLMHAVAIAQRSSVPEAVTFGEYLASVGDDRVGAALAERQTRRTRDLPEGSGPAVTTDSAGAALARLRAVDWDDLAGAFAHTRSRALLMREHMRRAALWAQACGAEKDWPFFDVVPHVAPDFRLPSETRAELEAYTRTIGTPSVRRLCRAAVNWAGLADRQGRVRPELLDPYEPILTLFERGGRYSVGQFIDLYGVMIPYGSLRSHLAATPFLSLGRRTLDALDAVGSGNVTYYAKIDDNGPRSSPRGLVRRRTDRDGGTHDDAFTRNLRWEPTEYLRLYRLDHNDIDHVEIPEQEAAAFIERMIRSVDGSS